jgi:hypothetical protein
MVPLYATRIEDLGPGDLVRVECLACGYNEMIPPSGLLGGITAAAVHAYRRLGIALPLSRV